MRMLGVLAGKCACRHMRIVDRPAEWYRFHNRFAARSPIARLARRILEET
jgi:hypothetical protein